MFNNIKISTTLGWLLSLTSIGYFIYYASDIEFDLSILDVYDMIAIFVLSLLYMLVIVALSQSWNILLRQHNSVLHFSDAIAVFCKSQFAKYLPGNIGHHIGRALLAKQKGVPVNVTIQTIALESAWLVSMSGSVSVAALYFSSHEYIHGLSPLLDSEWLFYLAVAGFFFPYLSVKVLNKYFSSLLEKMLGIKVLSLPSKLDAFKVLLIMLSGFFVAGVTLDAIALLIIGVESSRLFFLAGLYAISWAAGYLVPGAPAGIGVRELIMVAGLAPLYGNEAAVFISLLFRIITTLGDVEAFFVGVLSDKQQIL